MSIQNSPYSDMSIEPVPSETLDVIFETLGDCWVRVVYGQKSKKIYVQVCSLKNKIHGEPDWKPYPDSVPARMLAMELANRTAPEGWDRETFSKLQDRIDKLAGDLEFRTSRDVSLQKLLSKLEQNHAIRLKPKFNSEMDCIDYDITELAVSERELSQLKRDRVALAQENTDLRNQIDKLESELNKARKTDDSAAAWWGSGPYRG